MKRNTIARPDACNLARELGMIFEQLRRHERVADADQSEESRTKLGNFKRGAVERVQNLMPAIWQVLSDATIQHPDVLEKAMAQSMPSPRQTSHTWGPFLGRLRGILDSASGAMPAASSAHADRFGVVAISHADPDRESFAFSPTTRSAVQQTKDFTCKEIAEQWSLGQSTVRRIFRDEPGVLRIAHSRRRGKRDYVSLRIPAPVAARVRARLSRPLFKVE